MRQNSYKCTELYQGEDEIRIIRNNPDIGIDWPLEEMDEIILSDKSKKWMNFNYSKSDIEFTHNLVWFINKIKTR